MIRLSRFGLPWRAALLAGCALEPGSSYVAQLQQPADAEILADGIAGFVAMRLPAASSTVALDPTRSDQARNSLTPALAAALRRRGFAVAEDGQMVPAGVHQRARLSQIELAQRATLAQQVISLIEVGRANPTVQTLQRLADALGYPLADLLKTG